MNSVVSMGKKLSPFDVEKDEWYDKRNKNFLSPG
jgi:hypothetical protein